MSNPPHLTKTEENSGNLGDGILPETQPHDKTAKHLTESKSGNNGFSSMNKENTGVGGSKSISNRQAIVKTKSCEPKTFAGDDTVVVKFVDTAIVGKSEAEDACHHGLVDPTINMKEAMNAINNMFKEPLDTAPIERRSHRSQRKDHSSESGFKVFVDESVDNGTESSKSKSEEEISASLLQLGGAQTYHPHEESFKIFVDGEENDDIRDRSDEEENLEQNEAQNSTHIKGFVFPSPKDSLSESSDEQDAENLPQVKLREDTVVHRFVGSTIVDEPKVESVCHHGLLDPTINLKQAMDDINNMFGKPMDFVRAKRRKNQDKAPIRNDNHGGFSILPDDDLGPQRQAKPKSSGKLCDPDLYEPTLFTKEAMDDINKMFGMPLDF